MKNHSDRTPDGLAPCGHTRRQAEWLKCTDEECRAEDGALVRAYQAWVRAGRPEFNR